MIAEKNKFEYMDKLKKTPEGRAKLRAEGWVIEEKETI
jgi:hypothetical protein